MSDNSTPVTITHPKRMSVKAHSNHLSVESRREAAMAAGKKKRWEIIQKNRGLFAV